MNYYHHQVLVLMNFDVLGLLRLTLFEMQVVVHHHNLGKVSYCLLLVLVIKNLHVLGKQLLRLFEMLVVVHHC